MEVRCAESAGFCFGVRRAVEQTLKIAENAEGPVYTWGPVVHNENVIRMLSEKGVSILNTEEDLDHTDKGEVVIRAHGVPEALENRIREAGFRITDATCPFVKKIHQIVREHSEAGEEILITGDPEHPEVQGIIGWAKGPVTVFRNEAEAADFVPETGKKYCLVSQTTYNYKKFENIVEKLKCLGYNGSIANTICSATRDRQTEAAEIAENVDLMLVIGSGNSSNSQKLYEICKTKCNHTYFIQDTADIQSQWFYHIKCVGITAGASTPNNIIEEVQTHVRKF